MITAFNTVTKQLTTVEKAHLLKPANQWIVNPVIDNVEHLVNTSPEYWIYEEESTVLRVMTLEERNTNVNRVQQSKRQKIAELSSRCELDIVEGVSSSALGSPQWYDSSAYDQLNLISALQITAPSADNPNGGSIFFACREGKGMLKQYQAHSYNQLRKVSEDQAQNRLYKLQRFSLLKAKVQDCVAIDEIEAVSWETEVC
jgi:hypothetical protein